MIETRRYINTSFAGDQGSLGATRECVAPRSKVSKARSVWQTKERKKSTQAAALAPNERPGRMAEEAASCGEVEVV